MPYAGHIKDLILSVFQSGLWLSQMEISMHVVVVLWGYENLVAGYSVMKRRGVLQSQQGLF